MINWRPKGASGWNQLHLAASTGDLPTLRNLIRIAREDSDDVKLQLSSQKESKLDIRTKSGDTALHIALRKGHAEAARELINAGCDVQALGARGETALHIVASRGMLDELHWLVNNFGLDIHALTKDGSTCIHMAAAEDRCDTLRVLYSLGSKLDIQNDSGETPLHAAARAGSVGAVLWLIEKDPGLVRKINKASKDAEAVARDAGRIEAAAAILDAKNVKKRVNKTVNDFQKLLSRGENLVVVKDWLDRLPQQDVAALVDSVNTKSGSNAFLEACAGGDIDVCKYLFSLPGKRELVNSKSGATALQTAASRGHLNVIQFLLDELELDPSRADAKGTTPIQEATKLGFTEVVKVLKDAEEKRHVSLRQRPSQNNLVLHGAAPASRPATPERQLSETSEASSDHSSSHRSVSLQRNLSGISTPSGEMLPVDEEVIALLQRASLPGSWVGKLAEQGWGTLSNISLVLEADLIEMGMTKGHRRALLHELDLIKEEKRSQRLQSRHSSNTFAPEPPPSPLEGKQALGGVSSRLSTLNITSIAESSVPIPTFRVLATDIQRSDIPRELMDPSHVELVSPSANPRESPKTFLLSRHGLVYSCSCAVWKIQPNILPEKRTCEHLKLFRGEKAEKLRLEIGSKGIVSKQVESINGSMSSTPRRSLSHSSVGGSVTTASTSALSEESKNALNAIRRARSEQFQEVPPHFIVKWDELRIEEVIGQGSFGVVRLATWRGMRVAVKELKIGTSIVQREEAFDLKREANTMARVCNHDNVVPLVGMVLQPTPSVVMAFMPGGSVEDLLVVPGLRSIRSRIPWFAVLKMLRDAAAGVLHLHCQGVIHRDLSARNLLVDVTGAVRVADFGFARIKDDNLSNGYTASHVGPIKWMAPEALRNKKFSERSDVFAFGVTMWEILEGERPWPTSDSMDVVFRVCSGERMELPKCQNVTISLLVGRCWAQNERERPSMQTVLNEVDKAWRFAGGHLAPDPSGGVSALIKGEAFAYPRSPVIDDERGEGFGSATVMWQSERGLDQDSIDIKDRPSFGSPGPVGSDEKYEKDEDDGYVDFYPQGRA